MRFIVNETIRGEFDSAKVQRAVLSNLVSVCSVVDTRQSPAHLERVRTWRGEVIDAHVTIRLESAFDTVICTAEVEFDGSDDPKLEEDLRISIRGALRSAQIDLEPCQMDWMKDGRSIQSRQ